MKKLLGGILMAIGILIAGASGLCAMALLFGGEQYLFVFTIPPIAIGVGLIFLGYHLQRRAIEAEAEERPSAEPAQDDR